MTNTNYIDCTDFFFVFDCAFPTLKLQQLEKCQALMAGKVKELLGDITRKVEANKCSAYCVGDSLTIADITVSFTVGVRVHKLVLTVVDRSLTLFM